MSYDLVYAGKNLAEFGLTWDNKQLFDKPQAVYEKYEIPQHNGDYLINQGKYKNVQISYRCYIDLNFRDNYSNLINYLNSFSGYQRLENTLEPDTYRMAAFIADVTPDVGDFTLTGWVVLNFECMPQEFLKTGETEQEIAGTSTTLSGNPVNIDNTSATLFVNSIKADLTPTQNISGAIPWAITGLTKATITNTVDGVTDTYEIQFHTGKNLLNYPVWKTDGITGGTATWSNNGVRLTANTTDCYTNYEASAFPTSARIAVTQGDVLVMTWDLTGTATGQAYIFGNGATSSMAQANASDRYLTYTVPSGISFVTYRVGVRGNGNTLTYSNVMIRKNNTEGSFEEYGATGLSTIYGGTVDFQTGRVTATMDVIEYYNGQAINEPWLSSLDTYAPGATPTTGAKVVYQRATAVIYDLEAQPIELLNGINTLTTNADNITAGVIVPTELTNPTYMEAQPLFIVESAGAVFLNGERIIQAATGTFPIYVDTETMDAYTLVNGAVLSQNNNVELPHDLIKLKKGVNYLNTTGTAKIVPRWWRL